MPSTDDEPFRSGDADWYVPPSDTWRYRPTGSDHDIHLLLTERPGTPPSEAVTVNFYGTGDQSWAYFPDWAARGMLDDTGFDWDYEHTIIRVEVGSELHVALDCAFYALYRVFNDR